MEAERGGQVCQGAGLQSAMIFRPGPSHLPPGQAPGGVIFRVYNRSGTMLVDRVLWPGEFVDENATMDAFQTLEALPASRESSICLVCYDGNTGLRWTAEDWAEMHERAGLE